MARFTCRECPDSAFALRFTRFGALPSDANSLAGNAQIQHLYCVLHGLKLHQVMRLFTCRECLDSVFVLRFTRFEALPGDAINLQGMSRLSICIAFYTV